MVANCQTPKALKRNWKTKLSLQTIAMHWMSCSVFMLSVASVKSFCNIFRVVNIISFLSLGLLTLLDPFTILDLLSICPLGPTLVGVSGRKCIDYSHFEILLSLITQTTMNCIQYIVILAICISTISCIDNSVKSLIHNLFASCGTQLMVGLFAVIEEWVSVSKGLPVCQCQTVPNRFSLNWI